MPLITISGQIQSQPLNDNFSYLNNKIDANTLVTLNVKDHGAMGDGITDDTAAIQNTLNACTSGGIVYFPTGKYNISSPLTVSQAMTQLLGNGISSEIRVITPSIDGIILGHLYCQISNLAIYYAASSAATTGSLIRLTSGANWTTLKDLWLNSESLINTGYNGISQDSGNTSNFFISYNLNVQNFSNDCLLIRSDEFRASKLFLVSGQTSTGAPIAIQGIATAHVTSISFSDCNFLQGANSLDQLYADDIFFENCFFDSGASARIQFGNTLLFSNCWFANHTGDGLEIANITNCSFSNCTNISAGTNGYELFTCSNISFVGGFIAGAGFASPGDGIRINSGTNNNISIDNVSITGTNNGYGVNIAGGGSTKNVSINNCYFSANATANINNGITTANINNNIGYNPLGYLSVQPSFPVSTVPVTNTFGVKSRVFVSGTPVVLINGHDTGLTGGSFEIGISETITLVYASTSSWTWFGL